MNNIHKKFKEFSKKLFDNDTVEIDKFKQEYLNIDIIHKENKREIHVDELKNLKVYGIGQIDKKFILASDKYNIYILDQHACSERINLENLMENYCKQEIIRNSEKFRYNLSITLNYKQAFYVINYSNILIEFGVEMKLFSLKLKNVNKVYIKSLPVFMGIKMSINNLKSLIDELEFLSKCKIKVPTFIKTILNFRACHLAVKFGDVLNKDDCNKIINELKKCKSPLFCAHGRPSILKLLKFERKRSKNVNSKDRVIRKAIKIFI